MLVGYHWLILFRGTDPLKIEVKQYLSDFPVGSVVKTPHSQCKGPGFDPWSGTKILHATTKSPQTATKITCPTAKTWHT